MRRFFTPGGKLHTAFPTVLIVLFWTVLGGVNLVLSSADGFHTVRTLAGSVTALVGIPLSLALRGAARIFRRLPRVVGLFGYLILVLAAGTALWIFNTSLQAWAAGHAPVGVVPTDWFMQTRMNWLHFTAILVLQISISALVDKVQALNARERQLTEAKLAALRFQLNPHFLFNTLNAIATLAAEAGARDAELMISKLSVFLRTSLAGEPTELVSLATELDMIQAYLAIEAVRFGDRLNVNYECEAGLTDALVPNFILQPLIENAVKYAVAPARRTVTVSVRAAFRDDTLILTVEDDGGQVQGSASPGMGLGLRNVAARLETLYGPNAAIDVQPSQAGFAVTLTMPLRWARDGL